MQDNTKPIIVCESCDPWSTDECCVGLLNNCKVIVKPMVYDYIEPVIIVVPIEHAPLWQLSSQALLDMHKTVSQVSAVFVSQGKFPNFFTGGNINNAKYGLPGVHAHVHVEPRETEDPAYNTFPAHVNKRFLSGEEIEAYKAKWKVLLGM